MWDAEYMSLLSRVLQVPLCFAGVGAAALWAHVIASYVSASGLPLVSYALFVCTLGVLLSAALVILPQADKRLIRYLSGLMDAVISVTMALLFLAIGISLAAQGTCSAFVQQQQQQLDAAALVAAQSHLGPLTGSSSSIAGLLPQSDASSGVTVRLLPDGEVLVNSSTAAAPPPATAPPAPPNKRAAAANANATQPASKTAAAVEYWQPAAAGLPNSLGLGVTVTATPAGQPVVAAPGLPEVALPPATQSVSTTGSTNSDVLDQFEVLLDYLDTIGPTATSTTATSSKAAAPQATQTAGPEVAVGRKMLASVTSITANSPRTFTAALTEALCAAWDLLLSVSFSCSILFAVSAVFAVYDMRDGKGLRFWWPLASRGRGTMGAHSNSSTEVAASVAEVAVGYPVLQPEGQFVVGYPVDIDAAPAIGIHTATVVMGIRREAAAAHVASADDELATGASPAGQHLVSGIQLVHARHEGSSP